MGIAFLSELDFCGLVIGQTYYIQHMAWDAASRGVYTLDIICPSPLYAEGACCFPDGTCQVLTTTQCTNQGGQPQAAGTDCTADICQTGACCEADGTCTPSGPGLARSQTRHQVGGSGGMRSPSNFFANFRLNNLLGKAGWPSRTSLSSAEST